jgi:hypothetical protein
MANFLSFFSCCRSLAFIYFSFSIPAGLVYAEPLHELLENYPQALSANNRVMGLILTYNFDHIDPLLIIINEYVSMCEGGWNTTIVLTTASDWTDKLRLYLRFKTYCYRIGNYIDIRYDNHNSTVGTLLGAKHRT